MAKRKIVWSHRARIKLLMFLDFYAEINQSKTYSKKLYAKFHKELSLLLKQPEIVKKTDLETVRGFIVDEFLLFYKVTAEKIIVHTLWDCRQNTADLIIK